MRIGAFRWMVMALVLPLLAGGCSTQPNLGEEPENPLFEIRQMLHRRAEALSRGDSAAYLSNLSPQARETEKVIAEGAAAVPLRDVDLVFTPPRSSSLDSKSFAGVPTQFVYRYEGLPSDNAFRFDLTYDVQKRNGSWLVTASKIDSSETPPPVWATGPVETKTSDHFLALYRPGVQGISEAISLAEEARASVVPMVKLPPDPKSLLLLARDHEEFKSMAGKDLPEGVLALAAFESRDGRLPSRHMLVNLQAVLADPNRIVKGHAGDVTAKAVFQHELGHLVLLRYSSALTPGWVSEGAAMYLSGERRVREWSAMAKIGLLDRDLSGALVPEDQSEEEDLELPGELYPYANAAVLYLVENFGAERFWTFYRTFKRLDPETDSLAGARAAATLKLLKDIYRLDPKTLDLRVRDYIKAHI